MTIVHDMNDLEGRFTFEFWILDRKPEDSENSFEGINLVTKDVTGKYCLFHLNSRLTSDEEYRADRFIKS